MNNYWRPLILPDEIKLEYINIILGILDQRTNLLNYFIILGKIYWWNCRKNKQIPLYSNTQILFAFRRCGQQKISKLKSLESLKATLSGKMKPCFE